MIRRSFIKNLGLVSAAIGLSSFQGNHNSDVGMIIKPEALKKGDRIMMISPASSASQEKIDKAVSALQKRGFIVEKSKYLEEKNGFLAGTDEQRLEDFHEAWNRKDVKGIWCLRGGYGTMRLLPSIDFDLIAANPKIFIGYSDITALHSAIFRHTGLITFHGPVGTSAENEFSENGLRVLYEKNLPFLPLETSKIHRDLSTKDNLYKKYTVHPGTGIGRLVGGNLSLVSALCGTDSLPSFAGKIVYLEDIGEKPYRIDRMLVQVMQATDIAKSAGIVHGIYHDCRQKDSSKQDIHQVIKQTLGTLKVPQCYGLSFGHLDEQFTIPNGVYARLDASNMQLTLLENAVK